MTDSLLPWLGLRYRFDEAARSDLITQRVAALCQKKTPLRVLDLGAGTGANFRYLAPRLGGDQTWLLVDQSGALLTQARKEIGDMAAARSWQVEGPDDASLAVRGTHNWAVQTEILDMAEGINSLDFRAFDLVTASALTDLVSPAWFQRLIEACWDARALVAIVLTYDGRKIWDPPEPMDGVMLDWFNGHQRTDKGFGPAMGPDATALMIEAAQNVGYTTLRDGSDWHIGPGDGPMHEAMIGWLTLATEEFKPDEIAGIRRWAAKRRRLIDAGACTLTVGHFDILAYPPQDESGR